MPAMMVILFSYVLHLVNLVMDLLLFVIYFYKDDLNTHTYLPNQLGYSWRMVRDHSTTVEVQFCQMETHLILM